MGLQTTYEAISELINRAHRQDLYVETVKRICQQVPKAEIVSHLINGLPGETHEMMVENVRRCVTDNETIQTVLHLLHLMTNTRMQRDYHEATTSTTYCQEEYVKVICDQLEIIPKHIVIHRITGDATGYVDWPYVESQQMGSPKCYWKLKCVGVEVPKDVS